MLITCKCTSLCKKLDCDVKSEPPYLVTTFAFFVFTTIHDRVSHSLHVDSSLPFLPSLIVAINNPPCCCDIDIGGPSLAPLVLTVACDLPTHDPTHVDRLLLSPPYWLQLLVTLLVIVILILVSKFCTSCAYTCL